MTCTSFHFKEKFTPCYDKLLQLEHTKNKIYIDIQTDGAITKGCTSRRVYILTGIELNLFTNWSVYNPGIYGYHNSVYISYKKGQGKFK